MRGIELLQLAVDGKIKRHQMFEREGRPIIMFNGLYFHCMTIDKDAMVWEIEDLESEWVRANEKIIVNVRNIRARTQ